MTVNNILFFNLSKFSTFLRPNLFFKRSLNLSVYLTNKHVIREGKTFNKLLGYNNKKKKFCVGSFVAETPALPGFGSKKIKGGKDSSRRTAVLNKLFMTHITELMATGQAASIISGLNIEISRVSICSTFALLNVYWIPQGTETDQLIEDRLLNIAASLRHELSQLRVMGVVPRIVFCKDKYYRKFTEVEELLKIADYGDEYIPLTTGERFKEDNSATYTSEEELSKEMPEEKLPEMSQNTLNLNHANILEKIQKGMEKSKAAHRRLPGFIPEVSEGLKSEITIANIMSAKERKEGLENFLLKRRIARESNIKKQRRFLPEIVLNSNNDDDDYLDELDKFINERDYLDEEKEDR